MKTRRVVTAIVVASCVALAALGSSSSAAATPTCGTLPLSQTHYTHVIWVWMENHSYSSIIGSSAAPYENALARACGLATNYHNITHPSLPNYIGATSGLGYTALQKFTSDCTVSSTCSTTAQSVFGQVPSHWRAYEESMPANCYRSNTSSYAVRHNPPPYYTNLAGCTSFDVPFTHLATDLQNHTLPAFAFVTPNLCDDTHNCSVATGDQWLQAHLPAIFNSTEYRTGTVALFLTWDEGEGGSSNTCSANTTDVGCHVANIVASASTHVGTRSSALFSHYSMLRTTEQLLHVSTLGDAGGVSSMLTAFNL